MKTSEVEDQAMGTLFQRRLVQTVDVTIAIPLVAFLVWLFASSIPESAVHGSPGSQRLLRRVIPEGWAFFTRPAREITHKVYRESTDGSYIDDSVVNVKLSNRISPSRLVRVRSISLGAIYNALPDDAWQVCKGGPTKCGLKLRGGPSRAVTLSFHRPGYCGELLIERSVPVPWALRDSYRKLRREAPAEYAKVRVDCEKLERN